MARIQSINRRVEGARQIASNLTNLLRDLQPVDAGHAEEVDDQTASDLWTLHLALADGMTEEEFRGKEPAVYERLQSR